MRLSQYDILAVGDAGQSEYYDFHVPLHENYYAGGMFHHNTGKTALASFTLKTFNIDKWCVTKKNGVDMTVDAVREMANELKQTNMFGGYRAWQLDECDMSAKVGQARFLSIADELQTVKNVVIAATCNSHIDELDERFVRRFQIFEVKGPTIAEMLPLTEQWVGKIEAQKLCTIAAQDPENARIVRPINVGAFFKDLTTIVMQK